MILRTRKEALKTKTVRSMTINSQIHKWLKSQNSANCESSVPIVEVLHPMKNLLTAEILKPRIVDIELRRSLIYGVVEKVRTVRTGRLSFLSLLG